MAAPLQSFIDDPMSTAEQFDVVSGMHIQRSLVSQLRWWSKRIVDQITIL